VGLNKKKKFRGDNSKTVVAGSKSYVICSVVLCYGVVVILCLLDL